jgi:hypothetical protein
VEYVVSIVLSATAAFTSWRQRPDQELLICIEKCSPSPLALQLLDTEIGAKVLSAGTVGVCQVLCVDAVAVSSVADTVTLSFCQSSIS